MKHQGLFALTSGVPALKSTLICAALLMAAAAHAHPGHGMPSAFHLHGELILAAVVAVCGVGLWWMVRRGDR